jgi:membrane fusion protein
MFQLFRPQAVAHKKSDVFGDLLLEPSSSLQKTGGLIVLIVIISLIFLFSANYTKKETVTGVLVPQKGIATVLAPRSGLLVDIHVKDKDTVSKGDLLFTVKTINGSSFDDGTQDIFIKGLEFQLKKKLDQIEQLDLEIENKKLKIKMLLDNSKLKINAVQEKMVTAIKIKDLSYDTYKKAQLIYENQNMSESDLLNIKIKFLINKVDVDNYKLSIVNISNEIKGYKFQLSEIDLLARNEYIKKDILISELKQNIIKSKSDYAYNVYAPISGTVSSFIDKLGGSIKAEQEVLSILPKDFHLIAKLNVPNQAVGFILKGQVVRLRYKSFSYQKFGVYTAKVLSVGNYPISTKEVLTDKNSEVNFIVDAELERQFIDAYGEKISLQPGMQVDGDIIIESRSLIDWLFEPLLTISGKTF